MPDLEKQISSEALSVEVKSADNFEVKILNA